MSFFKDKTYLALIVLLLPALSFSQESEKGYSDFYRQEQHVLNNLEKRPNAYGSFLGVGMHYYNYAVSKIIESGLVELSADSLPEVVYYMKEAKVYLLKARAIDSTNQYVEEALLGIEFMLGDDKPEVYQDPQAFRVVDGDTINKIDELGMLQGEWERLHPDGSFRCKGRYKDNRKTGYWERKYPNGNWQYQINFENGFPEGEGKWYYKNGNLKSHGFFKEGREDGVYKTYYPNGNIRAVENYTEGKLNGVCIYYSEEGYKKMEGVQHGEDRDGDWIFYDENGKSTTKVVYENGVALSTIDLRK